LTRKDFSLHEGREEDGRTQKEEPQEPMSTQSGTDGRKQAEESTDFAAPLVRAKIPSSVALCRVMRWKGVGNNRLMEAGKLFFSFSHCTSH
jgi:hypothetical protein